MRIEPRRAWWKPRLRTRTAMVLVLLSALLLGLGWPAWQIYREQDFHVHSAVDVRGTTPTLTIDGGHVSPFWPRYWRRLVGRPYRQVPFCGPTPGFGAEVCEYSDPSMAMRIGGQVAYHNNPRQVEWLAAYQAAPAKKAPGP